MGEVSVESLVEGEGGGVAVDGGVDGGVGRSYVFVLEAGKEFLDVADALSAAGGVAEGVVVEVFHVEGVFETLPFCFGEEIAEVRHAEVALFVGTDALHSIRVVGGECEVFAGILLHPGCGIRQILGDVCEEISISEKSDNFIIVIGAAIVGSKSVVLSTAFCNNYDVEWSRSIGDIWIWLEFEAWPEKSKSPIDLTVVDS